MPHTRHSTLSHVAVALTEESMRTRLELEELMTEIKHRRRRPSKKDVMKMLELQHQLSKQMFDVAFALGKVDETFEIRQLNVEALKYV